MRSDANAADFGGCRLALVNSLGLCDLQQIDGILVDLNNNNDTDDKTLSANKHHFKLMVR